MPDKKKDFRGVAVKKADQIKGKPSSVESPIAEPKVGIVREYFVTIVTCAILALFVTRFIAHPMSVPTESMVPTILVGDRLIVDRFLLCNNSPVLNKFFLSRQIKRGDVIVFKYPGDPEVPYVKRVIGLPNETIQIRNKEVYIDNQKLNEPYAHYIDSQKEHFHVDNYKPRRIPENSYFVMGDNRDRSQDSRYWGFVPRSYILGRPLMIFWSYEDLPYDELRAKPAIEIYLDRIAHFFGKTRWRRMFKLIK